MPHALQQRERKNKKKKIFFFRDALSNDKFSQVRSAYRSMHLLALISRTAGFSRLVFKVGKMCGEILPTVLLSVSLNYHKTRMTEANALSAVVFNSQCSV